MAFARRASCTSLALTQLTSYSFQAMRCFPARGVFSSCPLGDRRQSIRALPESSRRCAAHPLSARTKATEVKPKGARVRRAPELLLPGLNAKRSGILPEMSVRDRLRPICLPRSASLSVLPVDAEVAMVCHLLHAVLIIPEPFERAI